MQRLSPEKTDISFSLLKVVSATFLLVCFLSLNKNTFQTRKNLFLFYFKNSFRSQENQILEFYIFKFRDAIKCLSIKLLVSKHNLLIGHFMSYYKRKNLLL